MLFIIWRNFDVVEVDPRRTILAMHPLHGILPYNLDATLCLWSCLSTWNNVAPLDRFWRWCIQSVDIIEKKKKKYGNLSKSATLIKIHDKLKIRFCTVNMGFDMLETWYVSTKCVVLKRFFFFVTFNCRIRFLNPEYFLSSLYKSLVICVFSASIWDVVISVKITNTFGWKFQITPLIYRINPCILEIIYIEMFVIKHVSNWSFPQIIGFKLK